MADIARVEPPAEHRGVRWHWLAAEIGDPEVLSFRGWIWRGYRCEVTPEQAADNGWRYVGPAIPPEPSDV